MYEKLFYVYILTNKAFGVFYIGITSNLPKRTYEHKSKAIEGFTKRYQLDKLVYYEIFDSADAAIHREKQLKRWPREWKINVINAFNPEWNDLYATIYA